METERQLAEMVTLAEKIITKKMPFDKGLVEKIIDVMRPHERCNNSIEYYLETIGQIYYRNVGSAYIGSVPEHKYRTWDSTDPYWNVSQDSE